MLSFQDRATIKHYITETLDTEPGVSVQGVFAKDFGTFIGVGVEAIVDEVLTTQSSFQLKPQYRIADLTREIDEMAEQIKAARKQHLGKITDDKAATILGGNGLRGNWRQ